MVKSCIEFEKSMGNDINKIARAIKYKGDIENLKGLELDPALLSIQQHRVKEKLVEDPGDELKSNHKLIISGCLTIIILIIILSAVGVYTVFNWIF